MIRYLKLENFRRHENTELNFSTDSQIVAITGRNGAGKTTILEAIVMALYGESRHGRRQLASLVRRGAEHEGMGLTCEFEVGAVSYRVERRWEKGNHSAALYANDVLHTQAADAVTRAVAGILGMDSVGFRLATVARQKELDGLAKMTEGERHKTITRLLRLDAVQSSVTVARERERRARETANTLDSAASLQDRAADLDAAQESQRESAEAHAEATRVVTDLDARIGSTSDVESRYHQAQIASSRADQARESAAAEVARLRATCDQHVVPAEVAAPAMALADIRAELAQVDATIATGQAQLALGTQLDMANRRVEQLNASVETLTQRRAQLPSAHTAQYRAEIVAQGTAVAGDLAALRTTAEDLVQQLSNTRAALAQAREQLERNDNLAATCETCGQEVSEDHKESTQTRLEQTIKTLAVDVAALETGLDAAKTDLAAAEGTREKLLETLQQVDTNLAAARTLDERIQESQHQLASYRDDAARLLEQVVDVDLDGAYANKTRLEALKAAAENAAHAALVRDAALTRDQELKTALGEAEGRLRTAEEAALAAAPSPELIAAWHERAELVAARDAERAMMEALAADLAGATARTEAAQKAVEDASRNAERAGGYRRDAEVAAKTARLLDAVSKRMATQIRPQLEGRISATLQQMSDGRFTSAKVSDSYEVTVCDHDGKYYPVSDFSGGEADLIALAVRLALAQVVAARHGSGGPGFLILDEVFGSQDETRRIAILDGLRRMRGVYGQVLLISHVGGIEEAADVVLDVSRDDEDEVARVSVLAA